jgi:5-methylcytosine-specific restriction endonuclease McrA
MCKAAKKTEGYINPAKSGWIKKDARLAIYLRDSFRCLYCCADLHDAAPFDITLDHVVAAVDGGSNKPSNLVTACRTCNCSRQDKPVSRFASPEALKDIRRNTRRVMTRYRKMAKALIAGTTGDENC